MFYNYYSTSSFGAILVTTPPITHDAFLYEAPFQKWFRDNAQTLLEKRPEVKDYDVTIVTSTYAAKACSLNATISKVKSVTIGFTAGAIGISEVAPAGTWYSSSADQGWAHYGTVRIQLDDL